MYSEVERLMAEKGVRVADVCRATGIDKATFSHWKAGKYTPKVDKIIKIANYFDVPIETLIS